MSKPFVAVLDVNQSIAKAPPCVPHYASAHE